ncbi:MAG: T9SS type A sorting domain-containing protein [Rhodothermales bacterium]
MRYSFLVVCGICFSVCTQVLAQPTYQRITPSDSTLREATFGSDLAFHGDKLLIANTGYSKDYAYEGAVEQYEEHQGEWIRTGLIQPEIKSEYGQFGNAIEVIGNELLVLSQTSLHVFEDDMGRWAEKQTVTLSDDPEFQNAGWLIKTEGHLFSGVSRRISFGSGASFTGESALIYFQKKDTSWVVKQFIQPQPGVPDSFGRYACMLKGQLVVSAHRDPWISEHSPAGSLYLYSKDGGEWVEKQKIFLENAEDADQFGAGLACFDDQLLVRSRSKMSRFEKRDSLLIETDSVALAHDISFSSIVYASGDTLFMHKDYPPTMVDGRELYLSSLYFYKWNAGQLKLLKELTFPDVIADWARDDGSFGNKIAMNEQYFVVGAPFMDRYIGEDYFDEQGEVFLFENQEYLVSFERSPIPRSNELQFSLFPNPANHVLQISTRAVFQKPLQFKLYDTLGRMLKSKTLHPYSQSYTVVIEGLPAGLYALQICNEDVNCASQIFIKQ